MVRGDKQFRGRIEELVKRISQEKTWCGLVLLALWSTLPELRETFQRE